MIARGRWRAPLLALMLVGCTPSRPIEARPALWRLGDGDTTIWLFGSIHALPPGVRWETPMVAQAGVQADTLILEILPDRADADRAAFVRTATKHGLPPLAERVAPQDRGLLTRGMATAGQSPGTLDAMTTWGAALTISAGAGRGQGSSADNGVEAVLARRFAGRRIGALETAAGQFAAFDRLPEASQRALLVRAARDAVDPARGEAALLNAWTAGDAAGLAADVAPLRRDPAIAAALVTDRNARWAAAIARRLARPGRVFVAVGAGHLVGPGSVVALLRARGVKVERIE